MFFINISIFEWFQRQDFTICSSLDLRSIFAKASTENYIRFFVLTVTKETTCVYCRKIFLPNHGAIDTFFEKTS